MGSKFSSLPQYIAQKDKSVFPKTFSDVLDNVNDLRNIKLVYQLQYNCVCSGVWLIDEKRADQIFFTAEAFNNKLKQENKSQEKKVFSETILTRHEKIKNELKNKHFAKILAVKVIHPDLNSLVIYQKLAGFISSVLDAPFQDQLRILYQLTCAVEAFHNLDLVLQNLQPANIGYNLTKKKQISPQILNYLLTTDEPLSLYQHESNPELSYGAPEILQFKDNSSKQSDIWALGTIFYEILAKKRLFNGTTKTEVMEDIQQKISHNMTQSLIFEEMRDQTMTEPQFLSLKNLLMKMLRMNAKERVSASCIEEDPLFDSERQRKIIKFDKTNNSQLQTMLKSKDFQTVQTLTLRECSELTCEGVFESSVAENLQYIDFSETNVTDQALIGLFKSKSTNNLRHLQLYWCKQITGQGVFEHYSGKVLEHLNISNTNISDKAVIGIIKNQNLASIKKLELNWCQNINGSGVFETCVLDRVEELHFEASSLTLQGAMSLFKSKIVNNLKIMNFQACKISFEGCFSGFAGDQLEKVLFQDTSVGDPAITDLLKSKAAANIKLIDLTQCKNFIGEGVFQQSSANNLEKIQISGGFLCDKAVSALVKSKTASKLSSIQVIQCFDFYGLQVFEGSLADQIVKINLSFTSVENSCIAALLKSRSGTNLQTLKLSNCQNFTGEGVFEKSTCTKLQSLDLSNSSICVSGFLEIHQSSIQNSLQKLNITNCDHIGKVTSQSLTISGLVVDS